MMFREKSQIRWLNGGARNTAFYQLVVAAKRSHMSISSSKVYIFTNDPNAIEVHIIVYYKELFGMIF